MVKIKKDKKSKELLERVRSGNLSIRKAMSTFPEPDICIIEDMPNNKTKTLKKRSGKYEE